MHRELASFLIQLSARAELANDLTPEEVAKVREFIGKARNVVATCRELRTVLQDDYAGRIERMYRAREKATEKGDAALCARIDDARAQLESNFRDLMALEFGEKLEAAINTLSAIVEEPGE